MQKTFLASLLNSRKFLYELEFVCQTLDSFLSFHHNLLSLLLFPTHGFSPVVSEVSDSYNDPQSWQIPWGLSIESGARS